MSQIHTKTIVMAGHYYCAISAKNGQKHLKHLSIQIKTEPGYLLMCQCVKV